MKNLLLILLACFTFSAFGQTLLSVETDLVTKYQRIDYWSKHSSEENVARVDSLEKSNQAFQTALLRYTSSYPASLTSAFKALQAEGVTIASSGDGLLRIYSWDTQTGGTMHFFANVYQYKAGSTVYSTVLPASEEGDPGVWYSKIYRLPYQEKPIYLAIEHAIFSSKDCYEGIKAFRITNRSLNDTVKIIRTKSGIKNVLGFAYNFFSVMDRKERPVELIAYNGAQKAIRIPVVSEDGTVTAKPLVYQFTGQYFERVK